MLSINDITINPSVIPEYVTNDNRVGSNDISLKNVVSPHCVTNIFQRNKNSIRKIDMYENIMCAESISSNESYETLWARQNQNTSQLTFDNRVELKYDDVVKDK